MTESSTLEGFRHNPYRTFRFQVLIDGDPVAGLRKMSALKKSTEVVNWRTAGDPTHERKLPGGTKYDPITLEQAPSGPFEGNFQGFPVIGWVNDV